MKTCHNKIFAESIMYTVRLAQQTTTIIVHEGRYKKYSARRTTDVTYGYQIGCDMV